MSFLVPLAVLASPSVADVIVSNLAEPLRSSTPLGNNPNPVPTPELTPWYWAAQSFVTDGNEYQLQSVEALVGDGSDDPAPVVVAELRADNAGEIGELIVTLTAPGVSGPPAAHSFVPVAPVTLQPNTAYWILLGVEVPGDGTFFWSYANTNDTVGPGSLFWYGAAPDSGVTWQYGSDFPYYLQVNGTPASDGDGDGVDDLIDVCCETPAGTLVDSMGRPIGDFDLDCDNDTVDYEFYMRGFTGPLTLQECP